MKFPSILCHACANRGYHAACTGKPLCDCTGECRPPGDVGKVFELTEKPSFTVAQLRQLIDERLVQKHAGCCLDVYDERQKVAEDLAQYLIKLLNKEK